MLQKAAGYITCGFFNVMHQEFFLLSKKNNIFGTVKEKALPLQPYFVKIYFI
jgi:hypothetical protein